MNNKCIFFVLPAAGFFLGSRTFPFFPSQKHPDTAWVHDTEGGGKNNFQMIHFLLLVNKQGQTRLAQYANYLDLRERVTLEGEVVRKCLQRKDTECSFIEHLQYKLIYRRYASLFFIVGMSLYFKHNVVYDCDRDLPYTVPSKWIRFDKKEWQNYRNLQLRQTYLEYCIGFCLCLEKKNIV